jgi:hypothetical protein
MCLYIVKKDYVKKTENGDKILVYLKEFGPHNQTNVVLTKF